MDFLRRPTKKAIFSYAKEKNNCNKTLIDSMQILLKFHTLNLDNTDHICIMQ